ncbi:LysR family transcriptional regulator [Methylobacterium brachiatum]|uniref:LysR family transcriptional regulator n=1 Tax=Methylobacterium brachiatum TaxID=269660 RepID=A0ABV1R5L1_9HYPH
MRVTLRQLEAFVTVARLSSVTAAAEQMGLSQPAVSSLLRELERAFGETTLLDRSTRTVQLTEAGRTILLRAQLVIAETTTLVQELKGLKEGSVGTISLACTAAVSSSVVPGVLKAFQLEFPGWRFIVHDVMPQELLETVLNGTADFGIGTVAPHSELYSFTLATDRLSLVTAPNSEISDLESLDWRDLAGLPTISMRPSNIVRGIMDGTLAAHGIEFHPVMEVSLMSTALAMTAEGMGHAILPPILIPNMQLGSFTVIELHKPHIERHLSLFAKKGRVLSSAAMRFQELVISRIKEITMSV